MNQSSRPTTQHPPADHAASNLVEFESLCFWDLDHDARPAPYENWRLPHGERVRDLDRPGVLTNIRDKATTLLATFCCSDNALLDVLLGNAEAEGRVPFQLPSSMASVLGQDCDRPNDLDDPLYPLRHSAMVQLDG